MCRGAELIRKTRDTKKFPLVFKGLTEYGFRRNLLGLKPFGAFITLLSFAGILWSMYHTWAVSGELHDVSIVSGLIASGLLLGWFTWVTKNAVKLTAGRYARYLLEAAMGLE